MTTQSTNSITWPALVDTYTYIFNVNCGNWTTSQCMHAVLTLLFYNHEDQKKGHLIFFFQASSGLIGTENKKMFWIWNILSHFQKLFSTLIPMNTWPEYLASLESKIRMCPFLDIQNCKKAVCTCTECVVLCMQGNWDLN